MACKQGFRELNGRCVRVNKSKTVYGNGIVSGFFDYLDFFLLVPIIVLFLLGMIFELDTFSSYIYKWYGLTQTGLGFSLMLWRAIRYKSARLSRAILVTFTGAIGGLIAYILLSFR